MKSIPERCFQKIVELIDKYDLNYIIDDQFNYSAKVSEANAIFKQLDPDKLAENIPVNAITIPIKIILVNIDDAKFESVETELREIKRDILLIVHENENSMDITAENVNKYSTLRQFISNSYTAFGNDSKDVALLKNAENSYFVGEAYFAETIGIRSVVFLKKDAQEIAAVIAALQ